MVRRQVAAQLCTGWRNNRGGQHPRDYDAAIEIYRESTVVRAWLLAALWFGWVVGGVAGYAKSAGAGANVGATTATPSRKSCKVDLSAPGPAETALN